MATNAAVPVTLVRALFKRVAANQALELGELRDVLGLLGDHASLEVLSAAAEMLRAALERSTAAQVDDAVGQYVHALPPYGSVTTAAGVARALLFVASCVTLPNVSEDLLRDAARSAFAVLAGVDTRTAFQTTLGQAAEGEMAHLPPVVAALDAVLVEAMEGILGTVARLLPVPTLQAAVLCMPVLLGGHLPPQHSAAVFRVLMARLGGTSVSVWAAGLAGSPAGQPIVAALVEAALAAASSINGEGPTDVHQFSFAWPLLYEAVRSAPLLSLDVFQQSRGDESAMVFDLLLRSLAAVAFSPNCDELFSSGTLSAVPLLLMEMLRLNAKHPFALQTVAQLLLLPQAERTLSLPLPVDGFAEVLGILATTPFALDEPGAVRDALVAHFAAVVGQRWSITADAAEEFACALQAGGGAVVLAAVWTLLHFWRMRQAGDASEYFPSHAEVVQKALADPASRSLIAPMLRRQPAPLLAMFASSHRAMRVAAAAMLGEVLPMLPREGATDLMRAARSGAVETESSYVRPSAATAGFEASGSARSHVTDFFHEDPPSAVAASDTTVGEKKRTRTAHFTTVADALQQIITNNNGAFGGVRAIMSPSAASGQQLQPMRLVDTATTRLNVQMVLDAAENNVPLLLEGGSGVGKTATVQEAADRAGVRLLRYNLSSHTGIDDIMTRVTMKPDPKKPGAVKFDLHLQPFAEAFKEGHWLLFDEFNLAPNSVLISIKEALDSSCYEASHPSNPDYQPIRKHPNFRLFACQNPDTGLFKGKREPLSTVLLGRFNTVVFSELPRADWVEIIGRRLADKGFADLSSGVAPVANLVVDWHFAFNETTGATATAPFPEVAAYMQTSLRDALKLVEFAAYLLRVGRWATGSGAWRSSLAEAAWAVYVARLHKPTARQIMRAKLAETLSLTAAELPSEVPEVSLAGTKPGQLCVCGVSADCFSGKDSLLAVFPDNAATSAAEALYQSVVRGVVEEAVSAPLPVALVAALAAAHTRIVQLVFSPSFVLAHGVCDVSDATLTAWATQVSRRAISAPLAVVEVAAELYCDQQRHKTAQRAICQILVDAFRTSHSVIGMDAVLAVLQPGVGEIVLCAIFC